MALIVSYCATFLGFATGLAVENDGRVGHDLAVKCVDCSLWGRLACEAAMRAARQENTVGRKPCLIRLNDGMFAATSRAVRFLDPRDLQQEVPVSTA